MFRVWPSRTSQPLDDPQTIRSRALGRSRVRTERLERLRKERWLVLGS